MKSSTKRRAKGKFETFKGKIKEIAGIITGQNRIVAKGKDRKRAGKVRTKVGRIEKVLGK